ncbi:cystinosin homolog isoform X2 [Brevipalpus obovatus]|uniref:cystinosin homolog isoform X2 n=1 Tax=Brevipalpus obovatus TaxID=246614 RepID=UPI003D9EE825
MFVIILCPWLVKHIEENILMCLIFERGDQSVNLGVLIFLCSLGLCAIFLGILTCLNRFQLLSFVDFFGSIKILLTVIKCTPQVYYNYCRQSTIGWSILAVNLDMVGSILSIAQMALAAFKDDDWKSLIGNFGKLGLGLVSMFFNLIFMVQHYLLYSGNNLVPTSSITSIQIDSDDPEEKKLSHKSDNNNNNEAPELHDNS